MSQTKDVSASRGEEKRLGRPASRKLAVAMLMIAIGALAVSGFVVAVHGNLPLVAHGNSAGARGNPATKYTCPMHPSVVSDRPGTCSICGMALVAQQTTSEEHASADMNVQLTPEQRVLANVMTTKVAYREFSTDIMAAAKVSWDERRLTKVSSRIAGRIEQLHIDFTGAHVAAGQPLLDIYSPDLVAAQKEYLLAVEGAEKTQESPLPDSQAMMEGLRDAARTRLKLWGLTNAQIAELGRTRQPKTVLTIFSSVSGTVTEKLVTAGQYVTEGAPLFTVAPLSSVWIEAELYESEIGQVAVGELATVVAEAYPGREFHGRLAYIDPVVNPEARTVKVRIDLPNPGDLLKPEMFVKVALRGRVQKLLAIPEGAAVITGDRVLAWVETVPGNFEPSAVTLGRKDNGFYEVLSGLSEGETVAASGGFLLDSESQLKAARTEIPSERSEHSR